MGQQAPGQFVYLGFDHVRRLIHVPELVAGEDTSASDLAWEHILVGEPVDGLPARPILVPPYPRIQQLRVKAMDSNNVDIDLDLFVFGRVDLSKPTTP